MCELPKDAYRIEQQVKCSSSNTGSFIYLYQDYVHSLPLLYRIIPIPLHLILRLLGTCHGTIFYLERSQRGLYALISSSLCRPCARGRCASVCICAFFLIPISWNVRFFSLKYGCSDTTRPLCDIIETGAPGELVAHMRSQVSDCRSVPAHSHGCVVRPACCRTLW